MPVKGTKQLRAILVLVGVALVTLAVGVAFGKGGGAIQGYESKIDIHYDKGHNVFKGKVHSKKPCESSRTVHVYQQHEGGADTLVGTTTTDDHGKWDTIQSAGPGYYYATVDRSETTGYGQSIRCGGAESNTIEVKAEKTKDDHDGDEGGHPKNPSDNDGDEG